MAVGKVTAITPQPTFQHDADTQVHKRRRKELLEKHPDIERLQEPYLTSAVYVISIVAAQHAIATFFSNANVGFLPLFATVYLVGAVLDHAMWVLIHDLTHDAVFKNKDLNMWFHLVANLPIVFPSAISFRHYHRLHHAYLNEAYNDPDVPGPLEARIFGHSSIGKAAWLFMFALIQAVRTIRYHARPDFPTVMNFIVQGIYIYFCVTTMSWQGPVYLFLSSLFAIGLHPLGARWIAEHYATHPGQETYSYYGILNSVSFNIGYHNEHHDLPRVPWVNLPKMTSDAPEFYNNLHEHPSYTKMLFDFIFNPNFTLETRVIHPSYTQVANNTTITERKSKSKAQ